MSCIKKQKVSLVSEKKDFLGTPNSDTFSECSFGTAVDNVWEAIDELKEELALLTSEMYILKNLLEKVSSMPLGPPPLTRQDALSSDVSINCCMGNSSC